ncbi:MAG: hypothetical protein JNL98_18235 [Bryobacterales bacterium]|nr:hypothetical protein [Bryobacterales bacterium]
MSINTYMQTRDHGPKAWRSFAAALLISDQLHTWIPSGPDIERAHADGWLPFSQHGMIELVEAGLVRVGGRRENFTLTEGEAERALYRSSRSPFDNHVRELMDRQVGIQAAAAIILHPRYDSASRAYFFLKEGRSKRSSLPPEHPFLVAREIVESEEIPTPPIVITRADQFAGMNSARIADPDIRRAVRYVSRYVRPEEQRSMHQTYQLMRIALEHANIMRTHQCGVHFEGDGYTSMLRDIAGVPTERLAGNVSTKVSTRHVEDLLGLVDFLLAESPLRSTKDLVRRHEKISRHRKAIWDIVSLSNLPTVSLRNLVAAGVRDRTLLQNTLDATTSLDRNLALASLGVGALGCLLWAIRPSEDVTNVIGITIAGYQLYRSYLRNKNSHYDNAPQWPFVMLYETEQPTKDQIKEVVRQLDYRLNRIGR